MLARLPQFAEGRLEIAAQGYTGATLYVRYKDWPIVVFSLIVMTASAFTARLRLARTTGRRAAQ